MKIDGNAFVTWKFFENFIEILDDRWLEINQGFQSVKRLWIHINSRYTGDITWAVLCSYELFCHAKEISFWLNAIQIVPLTYVRNIEKWYNSFMSMKIVLKLPKIGFTIPGKMNAIVLFTNAFSISFAVALGRVE